MTMFSNHIARTSLFDAILLVYSNADVEIDDDTSIRYYSNALSPGREKLRSKLDTTSHLYNLVTYSKSIYYFDVFCLEKLKIERF